jgi:hypothetical protein
VAGAFGFVEDGMGGQGVEFVPGQAVADRQPPRGISIIAALRQRIGAPGGGGLGGAQPGTETPAPRNATTSPDFR